VPSAPVAPTAWGAQRRVRPRRGQSTKSRDGESGPPCSPGPEHACLATRHAFSRPRRSVACAARGPPECETLPLHHPHHGAPVLVRRKGEAPGRMQVMDAALLQMARRALHTGPCRYRRLQAPWQRKLRSSRSRGDVLCLFLSADEGPNLTRPGDGPGNGLRPLPRSVWQGLAATRRGHAHGLVAPVSTSAPRGPSRSDAGSPLCPAVSACRYAHRLCRASRVRGLPRVVEPYLALSRPVVWTARSWSVGQRQNAWREQPCAPEPTPDPTGTRGSQGAHLRQGPPEPTHPITLRCRPMYKGCRGVSSNLDACTLFGAR
jgi:hypothetical protein